MAAGTRLGPYEILSPLGAGGMGEVYRARDTKLNREVALKVLPQTFAADSQRMARFQREAQVLASLNHPDIAAIYGLEESEGVRALVMELVEGPTLAERIDVGAGLVPARPAPAKPASTEVGRPRGAPLPAIPLAESLHIARQIAEALEAAHVAVTSDDQSALVESAAGDLRFTASGGTPEMLVGPWSSSTGDIDAPGWLDDGRILSSAWPLKATLWRFQTSGVPAAR